VLGYLVLIKVVATYKQEMRRESLRYIIVQQVLSGLSDYSLLIVNSERRGSLQYYAIIIALSTGVLISGGFADVSSIKPCAKYPTHPVHLDRDSDTSDCKLVFAIVILVRSYPLIGKRSGSHDHHNHGLSCYT